MSSIPPLPGWFAQYGQWSGSIHRFEHPVNEEDDQYGPFEVLVLAKDEDHGFAELKEIRFVPSGTLGLPPRPWSTNVELAPADWLPSLLPKNDTAGAIDMGPAGDFFTTQTSRRILSGHLIALRFLDIVQARALLKGSVSKTQTMKFSIPKREGENVTSATLRLFEELQAWGEFTPAKIIAELEGVSLTTIYNRLHTGRTQVKK